METTEFKQPTELEGLITWAKALAHYMEIALKCDSKTGSNNLAEIAIDQKDIDQMWKVAVALEAKGA